MYSPTTEGIGSPVVPVVRWVGSRAGASELIVGEGKGRAPEMGTSTQDRIRVFVRARPLSISEAADDATAAGALGYPHLVGLAGSESGGIAWSFSNDGAVSDAMSGPSGGARRVFRFDGTFRAGDSNAAVYERAAVHVVRSALDGVNGAVMAYGQTGSGKTHTMLGSRDDPGLVPRAVFDLFNAVAEKKERRYSFKVSYLEVYNEEINDLLATATNDSMSGADSPWSTQSTNASEVSGGYGFGSVGGGIARRGRNLRIMADDAIKGALVDGLTEEAVETTDEVRGRGGRCEYPRLC